MFIKSSIEKVDPNTKETPLQTAVRWNHGPVIEYLLENCEYESKVINKCLKKATTNPTRELLKRHTKNKFGRTRALLFCCFDG